MKTNKISITAAQLARITGIPRQRISEFIADGRMSPPGDDGKLKYPECVQELCAALTSNEDIQKQRLRLTTARAALVEKQVGLEGKEIMTRQQLDTALFCALHLFKVRVCGEYAPAGCYSDATHKRADYLDELIKDKPPGTREKFMEFDAHLGEQTLVRVFTHQDTALPTYNELEPKVTAIIAALEKAEGSK